MTEVEQYDTQSGYDRSRTVRHCRQDMTEVEQYDTQTGYDRSRTVRHCRQDMTEVERYQLNETQQVPVNKLHRNGLPTLTHLYSDVQ